MLALTIMQPWASAIMGLGKDVENRDWAPPEQLLGKRFAIHAGKRIDMDGFALFCDGFGFTGEAFDEGRYPTGALLGTVELAGFIRRRDQSIHTPYPGNDFATARAARESRWRSQSDYHWVLSNPAAHDRPIPMRGAQKLWRVPDPQARSLIERTPLNLRVRKSL